MEKITTAVGLKFAIKQLELKQVKDRDLLDEQLKTTYESLKPVNIIKSTLNELTTDPNFKGNLLDTTLSIAAGYLSKKIAVGSTHNPFKIIFGILIQMGVSKFVSKNTEEIKSVVGYLINTVFSKREVSNESK